MRRARKEGRYMGPASIGYENKISEDGRKYITPKEHEASILIWAFKALAQGTFNTEQIYKLAEEKGLSTSKSHFWTCIRNPLYCSI